jgi:hypothetical protein
LSADVVFPISDFDRVVADLVPDLPAPPKWAAVNAIRHLNRAWKLQGIDHSMALFRAITAEEEAAAALFRSLKRRRYEHAKRLKEDSHAYKNAVIPFLQAISHVLSEYPGQPETQLYVNPDKANPKLVIRFRQLHPKTGEIVWAYPQPPLNFSTAHHHKGDEPKLEDFGGGVEAILSTSKSKDMLQYVRERAEMRNQLLYATEQGYFEVKVDFPRMFDLYMANTFLILRTLLLIDPYSRKQLFGQQAIDAFLRHLKAFPTDEA